MRTVKPRMTRENGLNGVETIRVSCGGISRPRGDPADLTATAQDGAGSTGGRDSFVAGGPQPEVDILEVPLREKPAAIRSAAAAGDLVVTIRQLDRRIGLPGSDLDDPDRRKTRSVENAPPVDDHPGLRYVGRAQRRILLVVGLDDDQIDGGAEGEPFEPEGR